MTSANKGKLTVVRPSTGQDPGPDSFWTDFCQKPATLPGIQRSRLRLLEELSTKRLTRDRLTQINKARGLLRDLEAALFKKKSLKDPDVEALCRKLGLLQKRVQEWQASRDGRADGPC